MRYELVGEKSKFVGKTLWEIVGNLKNFGVGRLVKQHVENPSPEISVFKIVKVQPLPPNKVELENRSVMVWIDELFKGRRTSVTSITTSIANFQLIPKIEEEEYLKKAEDFKSPQKYICKYCFCPPLYKKLWEENSKNESLPKLKSVTSSNDDFDVILTDEVFQPITCSLYKTNQTVEQMYQEIIQLKKIIKSNQDIQQ